MKLNFRKAEINDLEILVSLLANDKLGAQREDATLPINANYATAFANISRDPNNEVLIAEFGGKLVGMLQLTYIPYLTHMGSWRCLIEGVRNEVNSFPRYARFAVLGFRFPFPVWYEKTQQDKGIVPDPGSFVGKDVAQWTDSSLHQVVGLPERFRRKIAVDELKRPHNPLPIRSVVQLT